MGKENKRLNPYLHTDKKDHVNRKLQREEHFWRNILLEQEALALAFPRGNPSMVTAEKVKYVGPEARD